MFEVGDAPEPVEPPRSDERGVPMPPLGSGHTRLPAGWRGKHRDGTPEAHEEYLAATAVLHAEWWAYEDAKGRRP